MPSDPTPVSADVLRQFALDIARAIGHRDDHAVLLARLLVDSDLRGIYSHGTQQLTRYTDEIQSNGLNPTPQIKCVKESPVSLTLDGDGGLGYFPAHEGTLRTIEKAKASGMAALVCRNHGHIGAAGIYTRLTLDHDLLCFCTSGVQLNLNPDCQAHAAAAGSPMSFSAPGSQEPALLLDSGVTHGIQYDAPHREALLALEPGVVLRALGLGNICQAWGGFLSGLPVDPPDNTRYPKASQGMFLYAFRIDLFHDPEKLRQKIDQYHRRVRGLQPLPHTTGAHLPGDLEAKRSADQQQHGIRLAPNHRNQLVALADRLKIAVPW